MDIENKVALVTGGARRVGREIAVHLAKLGAHVALNYKTSHEQAQQVAREISDLGRDALTIKADVSNAQDVEAMITTAIGHFGRLDVLINNAAIFYKTDFFELSENDWDAFMKTNLKGPFLCSRKAAKHLLSHGAGKIINIADVGGVRAWKSYIPYCVSKAGLIMLTKGMAKAMAPDVQVNAVAPGPVMFPEDYTADEKNAVIEETVLKRPGSPADVAKAVQFLIESDYITGEVLFVDGGGMII
ncbi:MAG: SDR family oxidoreductase [Candidatus Dadabacteria bacterium]|nr:SDR family oxidoreductase [Candidatus Dadabacteria bacterium]